LVLNWLKGTPLGPALQQALQTAFPSMKAVVNVSPQLVAPQAARERLTPLEERLARLLATIPIEVQREGHSLASLQASLRGRWRGLCHPGELGTALRKLGFTRERRWHVSTGFRALWYPTQ
jgi:hypothetical protein